jgi:hypothetical protein
VVEEEYNPIQCCDECLASNGNPEYCSEQCDAECVEFYDVDTEFWGSYEEEEEEEW